MTTANKIARPSASNEVHIWIAPLEVSPQQQKIYRDTLSDEERERADRLLFRKDRSHHIVAHGILRQLLARYLDNDPRGLQFAYGTHGKPALRSLPRDGVISFNLAHSGDLAIYAIAQGEDIGVDIERIRVAINCLEIAKRFFSKNEIQQLQGLPHYRQRQAFFNGWTRKEAFIKAIGMGLAFPLSAFDVTMIPEEPAKIVRVSSPYTTAAEWDMQTIELPSGYVGAVVKRGKIKRLLKRYWEAPGSQDDP